MDIENIVINLVSPDRRDSKNSLRAFARLDAVDDDVFNVHGYAPFRLAMIAFAAW